MSLFNYVDSPNTNLICCICRAPFTDPTTTRTCSHTFCSECILRALAHSPLCPVDRSELTLADLSPANPIVRSLVDELQVECVHRPEGCTHICQRQMLAAHLKEECEYSDTSCSEPGCGYVAKRKDLAHHIEKEHLRSNKVEGGSRQDLHTEKGVPSSIECEEKSQSTPKCPHHSLGCPYDGPLQPSEHLASCPYETFKDFLTVNTSRIASLTEQNLILRNKVEALEGTVLQLRRDINTTMSSVLGPWFRNATPAAVSSIASAPATLSQAPVAGTAMPEPTRGGSLPPAAAPSSSSSSAAVTTSQSGAISIPGIPPSEIQRPPAGYATSQPNAATQANLPTESFASYFPPQLEDTQRRPGAGHRISSSLSNTGSSTTFLDPLGSIYNPASNAHRPGSTLLSMNSATSLVPTFETLSSSSLPQAISTLRESLFALAQTMDIISRRNEMALGNETVRLGEEMMGLRKQMQAMRMQMHGIMVELSMAGGAGAGPVPGVGGPSSSSGVGPGGMFPQPRMVQVQDEDGMVQWVPAPPVLPFGMGMGFGVPPPPRPPGMGQSITKL